MRYVLIVLFAAFFFTAAGIAGSNSLFFHNAPPAVIQGEDLNLEIMVPPDDSNIYDMYLFYRRSGDVQYKSLPMQRQGYLYTVSLNTRDIQGGRIEYYFAYEGRLGQVGSVPSEGAEYNPFAVSVNPNAQAQAQQVNQVEVVILSPQPDEVLRFDELVIAASVFGIDPGTDISSYQLMIDGANVTDLATFEEGVLTLTPPKIRSGYHNIELIVYDINNSVIGKKEWSFRSIGGGEIMGGKGAYTNGSVFIENRYTNISQNAENYFRTGGFISGRYNALEYRARLVVSSEESSDRQPVNRYAGELLYRFTSRNNIYLKGGDFTPYYNPLVFQNKRVRGIQTGLELGFFTFDFVYGNLNRAVEGDTISSVGSGGQPATTTLPGTYEEQVIAYRPGFRFGETAHWNLNVVNSREQEGSIEFGGNLREAIVTGTDLHLNLDRRRILFDASFQASINNSNAGLEETSYDSLAARYPDLEDNDAARSYWDFLEGTGMISMTTGLNPVPSIGMRFETVLRYYQNNLVIRYINIENSFASPGNPYLLKDVAGFYLSDNVRLFNNQVFLNLFYRNFKTNRSQGNKKTTNSEFGATVTYYPATDLPSLTLSYVNIGRSNSITPADTSNPEIANPLLSQEDNTTQTFTISTSYNVNVSRVRNTLSLDFTSYSRQEDIEIKKENQSDYSLFGIGILSRYTIPLITRLHYSQSNTTIGETFKTETDIQSFFVGVEYNFNNLAGQDMLKPFLNLTLQNLDYGAGNEGDRSTITAGLNYRNADFGTLSVRYDYISYGSEVDFNDSILNARYQYNF